MRKFCLINLVGQSLLSKENNSHVLRTAFYAFLIKDEKDNSQVSFGEDWRNKHN